MTETNRVVSPYSGEWDGRTERRAVPDPIQEQLDRAHTERKEHGAQLNDHGTQLRYLRDKQDDITERLDGITGSVNSLTESLQPVIEGLDDAAAAGRLAKRYGPKLRKALTWIAAPIVAFLGALGWLRDHLPDW